MYGTSSNTKENTERIRRQFVEALNDVYKATAGIPEQEIEAIVVTAVTESRREKNRNQ